MTYTFDSNAEGPGIPGLLRRLDELNIRFTDLESERSSLEEIFIGLLEDA